MKTQIVVSTCALIISAYGITPAVAESFSDCGLDWTMYSPMPTTTYISKLQALPPDGSFASSWGGGKTPTQYEGSASTSGHLATQRSCDVTPRVGLNQKSYFPTC